MPGYTFGRHSRRELQTVHGDLRVVVNHAIGISTMDFTVHEGLRTEEEQQAMVRRGASKTLYSRHLIGRAVDLVPYYNEQLRWEWPLIMSIAWAMREAAIEHNVIIRWGGCWDRTLNEMSSDVDAEMKRYTKRRIEATGESPFLDGPHYEMYDSQSNAVMAEYRRNGTYGNDVAGGEEAYA